MVFILWILPAYRQRASVSLAAGVTSVCGDLMNADLCSCTNVWSPQVDDSAKRLWEEEGNRRISKSACAEEAGREVPRRLSQINLISQMADTRS